MRDDKSHQRRAKLRCCATDLTLLPIPNSVVKRFSADGSVGLPHVRVGHCQTPIKNKAQSKDWAFFV